MAIKVKPQGPRFKKFEIWTKMAKVPKPQGPKWQFTLFISKINVRAAKIRTTSSCKNHKNHSPPTIFYQPKCKLVFYSKYQIIPSLHN
ncbi:hypothetical protein Hanom_Chr08g00694231 [Helianthus anomalus]